jgi:hypothetical protein
MRDTKNPLDLKGFAQAAGETGGIAGFARAFGEVCDLRGFAKAFGEVCDLRGFAAAFAAGFREGPQLVIAPLRRLSRQPQSVSRRSQNTDSQSPFSWEPSGELAYGFRGWPWRNRKEKLTEPARRTSKMALIPTTAVHTCRLTISRELSGDGINLARRPPGPELDSELMRHIAQARADHRSTAQATEFESTLRQIGARLATAFLPADIVAELVRLVAAAEQHATSLQVALDIDDMLAELPWETLSLAETGPLVLHPHIELFRQIAGAAPAIDNPGPLRILVAIGSPEAAEPARRIARHGG